MLLSQVKVTWNTQGSPRRPLILWWYTTTQIHRSRTNHLCKVLKLALILECSRLHDSNFRNTDRWCYTNPRTLQISSSTLLPSVRLPSSIAGKCWMKSVWTIGHVKKHSPSSARGTKIPKKFLSKYLKRQNEAVRLQTGLVGSLLSCEQPQALDSPRQLRRRCHHQRLPRVISVRHRQRHPI